MQPTRTLLVTMAAGGLLVGAAVTATAITASGASADNAAAVATPTPSASGDTSPTPGAPATPGAPGQKRGDGQGPGWHRGPGMGGPHGPGGFGGPRGTAGQGPVLHGEFVTGGQNGATRTVVVQSGTVTARNGSTVTVRSTDSYQVTWTLDANTVVRTGWQKGAVKDIAVGDTVHVTGTRSGDTTTATLVAERRATQPGDRSPGAPSTPSKPSNPGTPSPTVTS